MLRYWYLKASLAFVFLLFVGLSEVPGQSFTVAVSASPAEGGSVTGSGTYDSGTAVTVSASPSSGYLFINWTEGASVVSTDPSYTFNLTSDRTLVANFSQISYTITTSANPSNGGSTTGDGSFTYNTQVTLTAIASAGYRFGSWTEDGSAVSTNSTYIFNVTKSRAIVANFIQTYTITTSSSPKAGGSTSGDGTYDIGTNVIVTATPADGYTFVNWSEGANSVSTSASYSFTPTSDRTLTANFIQRFTISTSAIPPSGGTTSGGGTFDSGTSVTVTATPSAGYRFVNWTENGTTVSTSASYTFTLTSNRTLVANFVQTYTITVSSSPVAGGTVSGGGTYDSGSSVTVTAVPSAGYRFVNWTEGGTSVSLNASYIFTASSNRTLVANFVQGFTISVSSIPAAGGSVTGGGTYDSGTSATVSETPATGFRFINWTENGSSVSTSASYTFTVTSDRTLAANFIQRFTISTSANPSSGGTTSGGGTFDSGTSVTVTATPAAGYRFVNWTENGTTVSTSTGYTFTATASRALVANFVTTYSVTTSASPTGGGSATGSGTFDSGTSVTVTATPSAGYRFVNWSEGGSTVSTSASYTFTLTTNRTLVANFVQTYTITVSSSPIAGGTVSGGGTYDSGSSVTVTAVPSAGYRFVNWTEGGTSVSLNASYIFTASSNRTLVANFVQGFTISVSSIPAAGGSVTGGGTYDSGTSATVSETPATGFRFINWTENGSSVSTSASYTFTVISDRTLAANFIQRFTISTSANPSSGGTTSGGGTFDSGTSITVTATPAAGYRFVNWTENGTTVSTSAGYTFTATASRALVANFVTTYSVTTSASPTGGGSATGSGTFDSGTSVTVTATPSAGYRFVNWSEGGSTVSTSASYTFNLNANRSLIANFIKTYTINTTSNPSLGGTTSGSGIYDSGSSVTVVALPASGYRFESWTEAGSVVSTNDTYTFSASANRTFTANFIQVCSISVNANPVSGGSTSGGGTFDSGSEVTLSANPSTGYRFVNWTEGGSSVSSSANYTFTATSSRILTAQFVRVVTVSVTASPIAGGTVSGSGSYDSGTSVTVTATPSAGYSFVNWSESGTIVSTSTSYVFAVTANRVLVANFNRITYSVKTSANPKADGSTSGDGTYNSGSEITVIATPVTGYSFINWTENNVSVSTNLKYTFVLNSNRTLVANFKAVPVVFTFKDSNGRVINNNDTIKIESSESGSFSISVKSNFSWRVSENSIWLSTLKENDTLIKVNYLESISVLEKLATIRVANELNNEFLINVLQKGRISQLEVSKFDNVEIYPNPATDHGYIKFHEGGFASIMISVSNLQGHILTRLGYKNVLSGQVIEIPLAGLPAGQYLISLEDGISHRIYNLIKY